MKGIVENAVSNKLHEFLLEHPQEARIARPALEGRLADALARLLPRATVLTPNLPEARALAGADEAPDAPEHNGEAQQLARSLAALGPRYVVLTGGHRAQATDVFVDARESEAVAIAGERQPGGAAHGSGCTHSAVLAAQLALGYSPLQAARAARSLAGEAVARGLRDLGAGAGPVDVIDLARQRACER